MKVGAARKAVRGGKVHRAGAWAVGRATSVSGAYIMCVQCTYMEESPLGSVGAARKAVRGGRSTELGRGCRSVDQHQQSAYRVYRVYVHGRLAPAECRAARKEVRWGRSTELGRGL